jgi:hypothetical protein
MLSLNVRRRIDNLDANTTENGTGGSTDDRALLPWSNSFGTSVRIGWRTARGGCPEIHPSNMAW